MCVRASTTFFSVSAAVQARPSSRGCRSFRRSTSVAIVGVSGESKTSAAGTPEASRGAGARVRNASTFAAYPPGERTKVSSPTGVGCMNSSLRDPPIAPAWAETIAKSSPRRAKTRSYAARCSS